MHRPEKLERAAAIQRDLTPVDHPIAVLGAQWPHGKQPLLARAVPAGFPSPADDYVEGCISLDDYLVRHKEATFFLKVAGHSMRGLGIFDGDLLVVDRALQATHESVVIAVLDNDFTVKQLLHTPTGYVLHAAHPGYPDIALRPEQELTIWGVVRWAIHRVSV